MTAARDRDVVVFRRGDDDCAVVSIQRGQALPPGGGLTKTEREIAAQWSAGTSVRSIAASRSVSPHTVRNQLRAIYRKLAVHSRAELALVLLSPD